MIQTFSIKIITDKRGYKFLKKYNDILMFGCPDSEAQTFAVEHVRICTHGPDARLSIPVRIQALRTRSCGGNVVVSFNC